MTRPRAACREAVTLVSRALAICERAEFELAAMLLRDAMLVLDDEPEREDDSWTAALTARG